LTKGNLSRIKDRLGGISDLSSVEHVLTAKTTQVFVVCWERNGWLFGTGTDNPQVFRPLFFPEIEKGKGFLFSLLSRDVVNAYF
jgi:hypothetical protein